jgi:hypothetical protein
MPIQSKDDAQSKADNRLDRNLNKSKKPKKFVPLLERDFRDLVTLADQLEWVRLKKIQNEKNKKW